MPARAHEEPWWQLVIQLSVALIVIAASVLALPERAEASASDPVDWIQGFEHGSASTAGGGAFESGTPSQVNAASARSGSYGAQYLGWRNTAWSANAGSGVTTMRFAMRINAPFSMGANVASLTTATGDSGQLGVDASGRAVAAFNIGGGTQGTVTGPVLNLGQWYVLEIRFDVTSSPWRIHWQVDGVNQTPTTAVQAPTTMTSFAIDVVDGLPSTADFAFDDIAMSTDPFVYPLGDGQILPLTVDGQGSHNGAGSFNDSPGGGGIDASSHLLADETPMTSNADYLLQTGASSSNYLELTLTDPGPATTARAARGYVAHHASTSTGTNNAQVRVVSATGAESLVRQDTSDATLQLRAAMLSAPAAGWTEAELDDTVFRVGFATDTTPVPWFDSVLIEVEYPVPSPIASPGGQYTNDSDASAGTTNPTAIIDPNPHLSWINNAGEAADRQRVQVASSAPVLSSNVIGYWPFENSTADVSGISGPVSTFGGTSFVPGKIGDGLAFNGSTDEGFQFPIGHHDNFTVALWARADSCLDDYPSIIERAVPESSTWAWTVGGIDCSPFWDGIGSYVNTSVTDYGSEYFGSVNGVWNHWAISVNSTTGTFIHMVNGQVIDTISFSGSVVNSGSMVVRAGVGSSWDMTMSGVWDEVWFLNEALDATEMKYLYENGEPPGTGKGPGTVIWDSSPYDLGEPLSGACSTGVRCEDIVFDVDGNAGSATPLAFDGSRYFARAKFLTQTGGEWSDWSSWDWFETAYYPGQPQGMYVDDADAQAGVSNPMGISAAAPHLSWLNAQGEDVDRQRVQVQNTVSDSDVLALWHMNDGVSPSADASGNGRTLALTSATWTGSDNWSGNSLTFAADQYARPSSNAAFGTTTDFSVEGWFRTTDGTAGRQDIVSNCASASTCTYAISKNGTAVQGVVHRADGTAFTVTSTASGLNDDAWHHFALTFEGSDTLTLYLDGQPEDSDSVGGALVSRTRPHLGIQHGTSKTNDFPGRIDEVRISRIARSAEDILGYYNSNQPYDAIIWDSDTGDAGVSLGGTCVDQSRCQDIVYGATGTPAALQGGGRYFARLKFRTPVAGTDAWTTWSEWDWFQMASPLPAPDTQRAHDTTTAGGDTNPVNITENDFHLSWVNNAGEAVDRQRVQVVNTPMDDVVGLWHLDGDVADAGPNGLTGGIGGGGAQPGYVAGQGNFSQALRFDGGDFATVPYDAAMNLQNNFTVDAWFRTTGGPAMDSWPAIAARTNGTDFCPSVTCTFEIHFNDNYSSMYFFARDNPTTAIPAASFVDGEWHHVALTVDTANQIRGYVDGRLLYGPVDIGGPVPDSAKSLGIGSMPSQGGRFQGDVDEVRILSRAMSGAEVAGYFATHAPHNTVMWDSDTSENGVALGGPDCVDAERCADIVYGATGAAEELSFSDARYYARAKFRTPAGGSDTWSDWSTWDWFETDPSTSIDVSGCQTGTAGVTEFGTVLAGIPKATSTDCSVTFGASGASTELRLYQADQHGIAAWAAGDATPLGGWGSLGNGRTVHDLAGVANVARAAVQDDQGRLIVVGEMNDNYFVARFSSTGVLDSTFNSPNGYRTVNFGGSERAHDVAIQPDGRIVVGGYGNGSFGIARLNETGSMDASFGTNGRASTGFAGTSYGYKIWIQSDGRILQSGDTNNGGDWDIGVVRWMPDGTLDDSFGNFAPGKSRIGYPGSTNEGGHALAVQSDGSIILSGDSGTGFHVTRLDSSGYPDALFGNVGAGLTRVDIPGGNEFVGGIAERPSGQIVVAGSSHNGTDWDLFVGQVTDDGTPDPDFGSTIPGASRIDISGNDRMGNDNDGGDTLHLQPDGRALAVGTSSNDFAVIRVNEDGSPDTTIGPGGSATIDIDGGSDVAWGVTPGHDGEVILVGYRPAANNDIALLRLAGGATIPDFTLTTADWDDGTAAFGACLRHATSGAQDAPPNTWTEAPSNSCTLVDDSRWNAIAATGTDPAAVVAETTGPGITGATVHLRFGVRIPAGAAAGQQYYAPMIVEAVSPNI